MAYYDYECDHCGTKFTEKETFAEHARHRPVKCPKCASHRVRRVIGGVFAVTSKKS